MKLVVKKSRSASRAALDLAIDSAKVHGQVSDPDHEVGDLLDLVEALYKHAPEAARKAALLEYGEEKSLWVRSSGIIGRSLRP